MHLQVFADVSTLVLMVRAAPAPCLCNSRQMRLPDRDGLLDALIAKADKIIKLDAPRSTSRNRFLLHLTRVLQPPIV